MDRQLSQIKTDMKHSADKVSETLKTFGILNLPDPDDDSKMIDQGKNLSKEEDLSKFVRETHPKHKKKGNLRKTSLDPSRNLSSKNFTPY